MPVVMVRKRESVGDVFGSLPKVCPSKVNQTWSEFGKRGGKGEEFAGQKQHHKSSDQPGDSSLGERVRAHCPCASF